MAKRGDDGVRIWVFSAVGFFALVILYFGWNKLPWGRPGRGALPAATTFEPEPEASSLPTAPVRMKIKRVEPRKYRREGSPPPAPVR